MNVRPPRSVAGTGISVQSAGSVAGPGIAVYHFLMDPALAADLDSNPQSDAYRRGIFMGDGSPGLHAEGSTLAVLGGSFTGG